MQWVVIAVLVIGGGIAISLVTHKADDYRDRLDGMQKGVASLQAQLRQPKAAVPAPESQLPEAKANSGPAPTPTPTPAPAVPAKAHR